jgi:hypothetical protein
MVLHAFYAILNLHEPYSLTKYNVSNGVFNESNIGTFGRLVK